MDGDDWDGNGIENWTGNGDGDGVVDGDREWEHEREQEWELTFGHFFVLFMSQILYVPCKRHGDVNVASVTCKKFSLSEPTDGSQNISSAFLSQVLCIVLEIMQKMKIIKIVPT